jgi:8-oxo-dGTP diphosphatase
MPRTTTAAKTYASARIAIDPVIFTIHDHRLKVFLRQREREPFKGHFELPGGLLLPGETAEETMQRKLRSVFNATISCMQIYTFTTPDRDPRGRTVSISTLALISSTTILDFSGWHDIRKLPDLAFDHLDIISYARNYLREHIQQELLQNILPKRFPLNLLQTTFEIIEQKRYDNRNFRKRMIISETVAETKEHERQVSHRPAVLYRFV